MLHSSNKVNYFGAFYMVVSKVMTRNPYSVSVITPVKKALNKMNQLGIRHLLVIDNNRLLGLISNKDIPQYIKPQLTVFDIMTLNPICVKENDTVKYAKRLLSSYKIASLPVLDSNDYVVGIVTAYDLL
jgi:CBS domain-containing protein